MTGPGYGVSTSALDATAAGIEAVLSGLRALGPLGMAEEGRGVVTLASLPGDVGHAGLNTAFVAFCDRWEWGVRTAVRSGEDMAEGLRAAGAAYGQADSWGQVLLARVAFDIVGDPDGLSADETPADLEAAQRPETRMPEWGRIGQEWADLGRDLVEGSAPGLVIRELQGADVLDDQLDDLLPIVG